MGNMSLSGGGGQTGGSRGGGSGKSGKSRSAALKLITLRDQAKTFTRAGQAIPDNLAKGIRQAEKELGN